MVDTDVTSLRVLRPTLYRLEDIHRVMRREDVRINSKDIVINRLIDFYERRQHDLSSEDFDL